ncbi:MAG: hypothetical protein IBX57_05005 [Gammaproteobacteria bacterium]|nr:hypothetical protein [Gammaproteobacteria bacterium]
MEIPGIAPFSGQPTLTNPLSQEAELTGRQTQARSSNETQNTVTANEQQSTALSSVNVVNESTETQQTGFNPNNPGGTIDITA